MTEPTNVRWELYAPGADGLLLHDYAISCVCDGDGRAPGGVALIHPRKHPGYRQSAVARPVE